MAAVWLLLVPLPWVGAAVLAGMVHELGHLILLWAEGTRIWQIRVGAFGARIETETLDPWHEFCAALAGPAIGTILCLFYRMLPRTAVCAFIQSAYNLLPVYPMDGGRAMRSLCKIIKSHRT